MTTARTIDHLRAARKPIPDLLPFDPRAAAFDDVSYDDVLGAYCPDPDEPRNSAEYYAGNSNV